jgi:hypothetical protein
MMGGRTDLPTVTNPWKFEVEGTILAFFTVKEIAAGIE